MKVSLLVFVVLLLIDWSAAATVQSQRYQVKSVTTDGLNRMTVALFQLDFDAALGVDGTALADLSQNETSDVVLNMFGTDVPLPQSTAALLGVATLRCDGQTFDSAASAGRLNETQLIPVAANADPILGFFNALRVPGASNFYVDMPASSRSLAVLLILQDTRECDPWYGCSRDTGLARRLPDTDFSRCSLSVGRAPDGTYLHAVAEPSTPIQLAGVTDFDATPLGDCVLSDLTAATADFEAAALAISGTSFDGLQASFWRAIMFGIADPIVACTQLLDELLTDIVYNGTAATDLCLEDGVGHTDDPCCSARLRYGDGCCAARPQNFSFPSAQLNPRPRRLLRETGCKHHRIVLDALNDYLQSLNNNLHPNTGCSASARQLASPQLFAEYFGFVDTCWDILRNNPPTCSRNEDCIYSGVCFSLECQPAYNSGYGGLAHTQCFADHMHPTIAAVTKVSLGMPDATRDEFVAAMQAQLWNDYCNSYWYSDYPPLWFTVPDSNALFGRIFNTDIDEETCLNWSFECTYDSFYSEDECFALAAGRDGMCSQDLGDYSAIATTFAQCTYSGISDPDTCAYFGGEWDLSKWDPCYLPGLDDEQSCLDTSVCPPPNAHDSGYWIKSRCSANWCLRRDLDQASCTADCGALQWQQTADGNGICIDRLGDSCDVGGLGEWWVGRTFYSEMYGTEEECTAGICGGGGYIYFGTDGRNCTGSGSTCTQRCSMCSSASEGRVLCTQPNATDSCLCFAAGGTWVESLNACRQPVGRTACAANGWNLWECSDLPDEQTCSSCTTPECQYLECTWQPYDLPCRSEAQCNAYGGRCGEKYDLVNTEGECDINNPYRPARCFQGCLYPPFFYDPEGFAYCPLGYQTAAGCIYQDVNSSTIGDLCTSLNGTMVTAAINEQQCQAYGQHCYEAEFAPFPTGKNETQCDGCLGNWQQSFKWSDGVWAPYARLPLVWNKVAFDPSLWWQPMMNYTKLEATVVTAAVARTRLSLQSEAQCLMNPLHSLLQLLACECTDVNRTEARDECGEGKVRSIDIGSTLLCAGSSSSVRLGGFTFVVGPDSVPSELGCVIVDATSLPAVQFAVPQQQSLSSLSLAQAGSTAVDNDYAVLDNRYGRQIGQLVSNVMNITLTPLSSSAGKRIDPAANQSIVLSNLTVCFDWLTDIVLERAAFPVQDLAWYSGGKFHPLDLQLVSWQASPNWQGRLMFCTTTNFSSGSFTPVLRVADYHQKEQVFTSVELAFIYIVAVLFLIAFVVALVLTLLTLYVHGFKGFCVNLFKGKQLAILILTLLLLFTGIRGIWLILSATETINGQSSLALDAVLTDLPIYIFFTLFMLLIFFWADLYHFQFKRKNSVLGRMKIPFILVNVFIYVFFFVIIIVYSQSDASAQPTVGLVYKCIVAGIGFSILTSFAIYGGLLMYKSFHSARATGGANNDQFIRMSVITLTCSIASFVQFIFLLLFAFTSIDNVVSILVYLFVVEVIPAYLLIYIFFHPKRLNETLTTSYGSQSSRKVRSLPGSKRFSRDGSRRSGSALSSRSSVPLQNVGNSNSASASN